MIMKEFDFVSSNKLMLICREITREKAVETLYNNFIEKARENHSCPLCSQGLHDESHFTEELQGIIAEVPSKVEKLEQSLQVRPIGFFFKYFPGNIFLELVFFLLLFVLPVLANY